MAEMEQRLAELDVVHEQIEMAMAQSQRALEQSPAAMTEAQRDIPLVRVGCEGDGTVSETRLGDGRRLLTVCTAAVDREVLEDLRDARKDIEDAEAMPADHRQRALRQIDREIQRIEARKISQAIAVDPVVKVQARALILGPAIAVGVPAQVQAVRVTQIRAALPMIDADLDNGEECAVAPTARALPNPYTA